ncbi:hypothetical protein TCAL_13683 [Tigriopus californicus]|uniref:Ribosomal RNA-processing protein 7 C-terminal domain-containing protein n=2 Tax=Tigriopus californicus TaxID=6832 RepID=A0A553P0A2_TIGCA|nr:hypothetical protein TCAL_13683 [Tigriopus californicus]|eukprot:TCALIF_13683-PA protein Name:"Similar to Rrp7a Ribosomal RNA-processing protein 7 homolog A (Mus musculus)" AED:0.09 eAED:0.09 QI:0/-1/0/1/-1/1/1/0/142
MRSTHKTPPVGVAKWRAGYNDSLLKDTTAAMKAIEEGVAALDAAQAAEVSQGQAMAEADEDGWITVSRHGHRKPVGLNTDKAQKKVMAREAKKRKRKELENFYKFQVKESKLRRLDDLREKFRDDKRKQSAMKVQRKFKPDK